MRTRKKSVEICCEAGCDKPRFCYGRCTFHFRLLDATERKRLKKLPRAVRQLEFQIAKTKPLLKWEFEPTPQQVAELIARYGGLKEEN